MADLEKPLQETQNVETPKTDEDDRQVEMLDSEVDECDMGNSYDSPPQQSDSVTMNVSMNGSGSGGIRDLLNVLKDISDESADSEIEFDADSESDMDVLGSRNERDQVIDDSFENSEQGDAGPQVKPVSAAIQSGNDLHKEKSAFVKAAGGDNPMNVASSLKTGLKEKLESLYNEIKDSEITEVSKDTLSRYRDKASADERIRHMMRWSTSYPIRDISTADEKRKIKNRQAGLEKVNKRIGPKPQPASSSSKGDNEYIQKTYYSGEPGRYTGD